MARWIGHAAAVAALVVVAGCSSAPQDTSRLDQVTATANDAKRTAEQALAAANDAARRAEAAAAAAERAAQAARNASAESKAAGDRADRMFRSNLRK